MTHVALYCRVSTDEQAERQTVGAQIDACLHWAEGRGYVVGETFSDEGVSGSIPLDERPAGRRLLLALEEGLYERVVVYAVDRLSRGEMGQAARDYNLLFKATKSVESDERVHFTNMDIATSTPEGELMLGQLQLIARYERRTIARRFNLGAKRAHREGRKGRGRNPFGYTWNLETSAWEVVEQEAEIVRTIFRLYAQGDSLRTIAIALRESGLGSPDALRDHKRGAPRWHSSTVDRLLRRDYYTTGKMTGEFMGDAYSLPVTPIIEPELFQKVQRRLRESEHFPRRLGTRGLFQGLIRCGYCGSNYHRGNFGAKQASTYYCRMRLSGEAKEAGRDRCTAPILRLVPTDLPLFRSVVSAIQNPADLARESLSRLETEIASLKVSTEAHTELVEWEEKKVAATKLLTRKGMPVETVMEQLDEIDRHIEHCQRQLDGQTAELQKLEQLQAQRDELEAVINSGARLVKRVVPTLEGADVEVEDDGMMAAWLASKRRIRVEVAEPGALPFSEHTTADKLLDQLGVRVQVIPNPLAQDGVAPAFIEVTGESLWLRAGVPPQRTRGVRGAVPLSPRNSTAPSISIPVVFTLPVAYPLSRERRAA